MLNDDMEYEDDCKHLEKKNVAGQDVCIDCGLIFQTLCKDPEWRYYGIDDNRYSKNPSRCHFNKQDNNDRSLLSDIASFDFPDNIKSQANEIYQYHLKQSNKKIYRNKSRKGLIFACVSLAYEIFGMPRNPDILYHTLNIKKKDASCGKKELTRTCFKKYIFPMLVSKKPVTVYSLIPEFLKLLNFPNIDSFLLNVRSVICSLFWDLDTLVLGLACKNIDYPANINKPVARKMLDYYFKNLYNPDTPVHPYDPFPKPEVFYQRSNNLLKLCFKQSIAEASSITAY